MYEWMDDSRRVGRNRVMRTNEDTGLSRLAMPSSSLASSISYSSLSSYSLDQRWRRERRMRDMVNQCWERNEMGEREEEREKKKGGGTIHL
jgi:hypothetical protein